MLSQPATYSGDPTSSPKDEVRFLVGDTGELDGNFELSDPEINYQFKVINGNAAPPAQGNFLAAAYCADALVARYKKAADKAVGDLHIAYSNLLKNFQAIASRLRARAAIAAAPMYVGGLSIAQKQAIRADPDLISTAVEVDGMDYAAPLSQQNGPNSGPEI